MCLLNQKARTKSAQPHEHSSKENSSKVLRKPPLTASSEVLCERLLQSLPLSIDVDGRVKENQVCVRRPELLQIFLDLLQRVATAWDLRVVRRGRVDGVEVSVP